MPATNPRLTITLKPSTAAVLRTLSELTRNSQSSLIAELLEANEETLSRLVKVLQAAHIAKNALTEEMATGLQQAQGKLEKQFGLSLEILDEATSPLLKEAEAIRRRTRQGERGWASSRRSP
jgi:hypothetical protein